MWDVTSSLETGCLQIRLIWFGLHCRLLRNYCGETSTACECTLNVSAAMIASALEASPSCVVYSELFVLNASPQPPLSECTSSLLSAYYSCHLAL